MTWTGRVERLESNLACLLTDTLIPLHPAFKFATYSLVNALNSAPMAAQSYKIRIAARLRPRINIEPEDDGIKVVRNESTGSYISIANQRSQIFTFPWVATWIRRCNLDITSGNQDSPRVTTRIRPRRRSLLMMFNRFWTHFTMESCVPELSLFCHRSHKLAVRPWPSLLMVSLRQARLLRCQAAQANRESFPASWKSSFIVNHLIKTIKSHLACLTWRFTRTKSTTFSEIAKTWDSSLVTCSATNAFP
jgi:hypothetical protein